MALPRVTDNTPHSRVSGSWRPLSRKRPIGLAAARTLRYPNWKRR